MQKILLNCFKSTMDDAKAKINVVMLDYCKKRNEHGRKKKLNSIDDERYLKLVEIRSHTREKLLRLNFESDWVDSFLTQNFPIVKNFNNFKKQ